MNPLLNKFEGTRIILGTNSPRRIELFKQLGLPYEVIKKEIDDFKVELPMSKEVNGGSSLTS